MTAFALSSLVACLAWSPRAGSDGRVASWVSVYSANDGLTVISPQMTARVPVHETLDLQAGYEADIISAASVDLVTAASPRGYHEVRQSVMAGGRYRPLPGTTFAARVSPSFEPDYTSNTFIVSGEREWLDRRLTTTLGSRLSLDRVGRAGEARDTWKSLQTFGIDASVGWVLSTRTVASAIYELQRLDGFQSSPYRSARMRWNQAGAIFGVPESVPDGRTRHAFGLGIRQAMTPTWFANTSARVYRDTFGVFSHTEEIELQHEMLDARLLLGISGRAYEQTAASFYQSSYVANEGTLPRYRTADKMLTRSWSLLTGLRASIAIGELGPIRALQLTTKIELYQQRFFDYAPLESRRSVILSFGLAGEL